MLLDVATPLVRKKRPVSFRPDSECKGGGSLNRPVGVEPKNRSGFVTCHGMNLTDINVSVRL